MLRLGFELGAIGTLAFGAHGNEFYDFGGPAWAKRVPGGSTAHRAGFSHPPS